MKKILFSCVPLMLCLAGPAFGQQNEFGERSAPGVTAPRLISKVEAEYSELARAAGIRGKVVIQLDVGVDGFVHNLQVVRTLGSLDQKAIEAVRRWRFQPGTKDYRPTAMSASVEVDFNLMDNRAESEFHRFARQEFEKAIEGINFNMELRRKDLKEIDRLRNSSQSPEVVLALEEEVDQLSTEIRTASEKMHAVEYRMAHADECASVYVATFGKSSLTRTEADFVQVCRSAEMYPPRR